MMFWDGSMGLWGSVLMWVSFVLFWGSLITALVILARSTAANRRYDAGVPRTGSAEDVLAERFARGEIDESEYTARLTVLRHRTWKMPPPTPSEQP